MQELEHTSENDQDSFFEDSFELVLEELFSSMNALQMQDVQSSEKALFRAKNIYNQVLRTYGDSMDYELFKIPIGFIEISVKLNKAIYLSVEERFESAINHLVDASEVIRNKRIQYDNFFNEKNEGRLKELSFLRGFFSFYEILIEAYKIGYQGELKKLEGKFIDDLDILRLQLDFFKNPDLGTWSPEENEIYIALITMINRLAEINEKKIERIIEKRKKIDFLPPIGDGIFIVHGHDKLILSELRDMIKNDFKLVPVILNKEPDKGKTIIEKFEHYARLCAFALVIITPDDIVENSNKKYFQGRPNVLFELGWFSGRFGREKVRILRQKDTKLPSDLNGIVTIDFNESLEEVYRDLRRELESQGLIE